MNKVLIFIALTTPFFSLGATASLDDVRICLNEVRSNQIPEKNQELINSCYDKALPWATSSSVQGKFLYVQVLQNYLYSGSDRSSMQALARKLSDYYRTHLDDEITSKTIEGWSDADILTVFDGIGAVEFYTSKIFETDVALKKYKEVFENLEERKMGTENQAHYLYSALLSNGQWDDARELLKRWPKLSTSPLPIVTNTTPPSPLSFGYYDVSPDLATMALNNFDGDHGPRIILSGFCHFAVDLIRDLSKEKEIANIMKQYGIAINPNDFNDFDFIKMRELKAEFPDFEFHPVFSSGAWFALGIHTLSSPTVLFLLNGQPRYQMSGFTKYSVADFCRGLKSIGLSASKSCVN